MPSPSTHRHASQSRHRARGFTLIEIMVGLVIGMLGIIVMMQVFSLFEGQKRTTTGSGDAQNTGAIALYALQSDIQQSGYGMSTVNLLGCGLNLPSGATISAIAPVAINSASVPAGDPNTDTLLITYSNTNGPTEGDGINQQSTNNIYSVNTPSGYSVNDRVIAEPQTRPSPCTLSMDSVTAVSNPNVTVTTGLAGVANGMLFDLGQAPTVRAYAVRNGMLTSCDYMTNNCGDATQTGNTAIWVPIASDIVSLRAQYGQDTSGPPMNGIVDGYTQSTPTTACDWARSAAIRIVLVARNGQYEKTSVTTTAPGWLGSSVTPIDLSGFTNWQHYRYKVFQTIVPIRNITSLGVQTGC